MKPSTESKGLLRLGSGADAAGAESANITATLHNATHILLWGQSWAIRLNYCNSKQHSRNLFSPSVLALKLIKENETCTWKYLLLYK
jgi:hypothetical protein